MSAFIAWRPMFDQDRPHVGDGAASAAERGRPERVFIYLEFASVDDAEQARSRLLDSGVLDRFEDKHGPNVL